MYLKKFYTRPAKYFSDITFNMGVNYVYGYRDKKKNDGKDSLNNLGKSAFLDMIDFTLGSDFSKDKDTRLFAAFNLGFLHNITVYLEFEVGENYYIVSRNFNFPDKVNFKKNDWDFKELSLSEFKAELCNIIFARDDYTGFYSSGWLRRLLAFYITILKNKRLEYPDPFKYLEFTSELEHLQYHLYLLNIDNRLIYNLNNKVVEIEVKKKLVNKSFENFISVHQLKTVTDVENKINQLKTEIDEIHEKIKAYKLADSQKLNAEKANELTKKINKLAFDNFSYQKRIDTYKESLSNKLSIRLNTIETLYNEFESLLGTKIKKELDEVIDFRKNLISSRKDFINEEIDKLNNEIDINNSRIDELDNKRAEIFRILSTASAVKNLSDATTLILDKEKEVSNLEGQINTYTFYSKQVAELQKEISSLESNLYGFRDKIRSIELEFYKIFKSIYNELFPQKPNSSLFSFSINSKPNVKSKLKIDILNDPEKFGKAKNRGRTLVYNLAVLFYSINKNYNAPRFLIHDGIFDGVDKLHFVDVIKFLNKQLDKNYKFQYIVTLIEEGVLTDKLDPEKVAAHEKIIDEAILLLTPDKPLFKEHY